jgi:hypothetical protein
MQAAVLVEQCTANLPPAKGEDNTQWTDWPPQIHPPEEKAHERVRVTTALVVEVYVCARSDS